MIKCETLNGFFYCWTGLHVSQLPQKASDARESTGRLNDTNIILVELGDLEWCFFLCAGDRTEYEMLEKEVVEQFN